MAVGSASETVSVSASDIQINTTDGEYRCGRGDGQEHAVEWEELSGSDLADARSGESRLEPRNDVKPIIGYNVHQSQRFGENNVPNP